LPIGALIRPLRSAAESHAEVVAIVPRAGGDLIRVKST
jgi:hypothetical protein